EAQLAKRYRVAEVNVDSGWVDPVLDAQRHSRSNAALEFLPQLSLGDDLLGASMDQGDLFINGFHYRTLCWPASLAVSKHAKYQVNQFSKESGEHLVTERDSVVERNSFRSTGAPDPTRACR